MSLADTYSEDEIDGSSGNLLNTKIHKGMYQHQRYSFGVRTAPATFQQTMYIATYELRKSGGYMDYIIVTGLAQREMSHRFDTVLTKFKQSNFHLHEVQCLYTNHQVSRVAPDKDGCRTDFDNINAMNQMPVPQNVVNT